MHQHHDSTSTTTPPPADSEVGVPPDEHFGVVDFMADVEDPSDPGSGG
jgi:hypothetical protein